MCLCVHSSLLRAEERDVFCALPGGSAGQLDFYRFYYFLIPCAAKKGGGVSSARSGALLSYRMSSSFVELSCISLVLFFSSAQPL
jgi:hypothetical protein